MAKSKEQKYQEAVRRGIDRLLTSTSKCTQEPRVKKEFNRLGYLGIMVNIGIKEDDRSWRRALADILREHGCVIVDSCNTDCLNYRASTDDFCHGCFNGSKFL